MDREEEKKRFLDGDEMELGEKQGRTFSPPRSVAPKFTPASNWQNNPILPVLSYCASSILMTVANKYILSFPDYNLNFFLLAVQVSIVRDRLSDSAKDPPGHCLHCCYSVLQVSRNNHIS